MADFEAVLAKRTARGANDIPGVVLEARNKSGKTIYSKTSGYRSLDPDAAPISAENTFWIASCTKLITSVAAMQCVERGQVTLDEPVEAILSELKDVQVFQDNTGPDKATRPYTTVPRKNNITLRQLLTHTSGVGYDMIAPQLMEWRKSKGQEVLGTSLPNVIEAFSGPLLFEPGESWAYGSGLDWAGILISRLNGNVRLEEYLTNNVFEPLGMKSTTFDLGAKPEVREKLVQMTVRGPDGTLSHGDNPFVADAGQDFGGAGLYSSVPDYMAVLSDLISDSPKLLKPATIAQMFTPQLAPGSTAYKGLMASRVIFQSQTFGMGENAHFNYGLGGLLMLEDIPGVSNSKNTLSWGGMPNLTWIANRDRGVAAMYASQVLPFDDERSVSLAQAFVKEVWRLAGEADM